MGVDEFDGSSLSARVAHGGMTTVRPTLAGLAVLEAVERQLGCSCSPRRNYVSAKSKGVVVSLVN